MRFAACIVTAFVIFGLTPARAQVDPNELAAMHMAAMKEFNAGKWAEAAAGLEKIIAAITDPNDQMKIGPIHYTLGAAYFNGANYGQAITAFTTFLTKFPNDARAGEARLALARATFLNKDFANALTMFTQMEAVPALRDQALLVQAECYKALEKPDDQLKVLERLISPEIRTSMQASGGLMLIDLYLTKDQFDKALDMINRLNIRIHLVENVVALNNVTVKLGDDLTEKKAYPQALGAYRAVRSRGQVIAYQRARIAAMDRQMQANLAATNGDPQAMLSANSANSTIKAMQEYAKQLLEEFEKTPDAGPAIMFRIARVWSDWEKKWEAAAVFDRLRKEYPESKEAESALYSQIIAFADLNRSERMNKLCDEYLQKYPKGTEAGTVGYLKGAAALQNNNPKGAITFFGQMLTDQPDSQFKEQMTFQLGIAYFMEGNFTEARKQFAKYLKEFPTGGFTEEAQYRDALALIFDGKFEEALAAFKTYQTQHAEGTFAADAGYRVMVCMYSAEQYEEVIAMAKAWQTKFPKDTMTAEVLALLADAYGATNNADDAAKSYIASYKLASTDEVLNYSLFEASKQLQKQGKWDDIAKMFQEFIQEKPDHPSVVAANFWIGKALTRERKTEEAKALLVEQLKRYINEPKREAVENVIQQLVQLCSKRPAPPMPAASTTPDALAPATTPTPAVAPAPASAPGAGGTAEATPAPATPPPLPPYDSVAELKKQLAPVEEIANATGKARLLYAQAELAKLRKKPDEVQTAYNEISTRFKVEDLSPVLLAYVGDFVLAKGDKERAELFYSNLREDYPKSDYLDFAYVGLGELAMDKKDYPKALQLFSYAADEIAAMKIKEATLGKARALLEVGKYDEAKKLFEQVASIREWRGESTAAAVFYLGELEARQNRWAEAVAHYQRVFVAYQKFLPWTAKAYIRSAEAFDKMGKRPEAIAHLREMLRNEKLRNLPEVKQAEKMLSDWNAA